MDVFVLVFAVVFIVGFAIRGIWQMTAAKCPHCRSPIDGKATVCRTCGRDV